MSNFFKDLLASKKTELTEKQKFEADNRISHNYGFICHGFPVDDFTHHLHFYSNGKVRCFDDLANLIRYGDEIVQVTEEAILNNRTAETGVNNDDETALMNARNFLKIFKTVVEYNERFNPRILR